MIGQILGHYLIVRETGAGRMGVVYRARDEQLDRDVRRKVLPAGLLADEAASRNEARALSTSNHPNIETVHAFASQRDLDFLIMELLHGVPQRRFVLARRDFALPALAGGGYNSCAVDRSSAP